jgi:hypothetical protein
VIGTDLSSIDGTQTGLAEVWVALTRLDTGVREGLETAVLQDGAFGVTLHGVLGEGVAYRVDLLVDLDHGGVCDAGTDFLFARDVPAVSGDVDMTFRGTDATGSDASCTERFPPPPLEYDLQVDGSGFGSSAVAVHGKLVDVSAGGKVVGSADGAVDPGNGTFHLLFPDALSRTANYFVEAWIDENGNATCDATDLATEVRVQNLIWPDRTCAATIDCDPGLTCVKTQPGDPEGHCGPIPDPLVLVLSAEEAGRTGCDRF